MPDQPSSIERYRREAARARLDAGRARDESVRRQLLEIAGSYEALADTVERIARRRRTEDSTQG